MDAQTKKPHILSWFHVKYDKNANRLICFLRKKTKFWVFPVFQVRGSNACVCHTQVLSLSRCFKSAYLGKAPARYMVTCCSWIGKKIYCTGPESNQRAYPAHSCKQNIITTTPFSFTIIMPLTIYDQLPKGQVGTLKDVKLYCDNPLLSRFQVD